MIEIRNTKFNAVGTIDCEINHLKFGWIPFTASPDDIEITGREIYAAAIGRSPAPYVPTIETSAQKDTRAVTEAAIQMTNPLVAALAKSIPTLEADLTAEIRLGL